MATSGTINGTNYTSYNHHLYLTWSQTKNVSGNYSTFSFKLYCHKGTNWDSSYKKDGTLTVAGTTYTFSYNPSGQGDQLLYSGSKTISHNSSGNASVSVSASWIVEMTLSNTYYYEFKLSGTATLDTIYRGTTISSFTSSAVDWRSLSFSFTTKDTAAIAYSKDKGSTWTSVGNSLKSGSFTIGSLAPNTSYTIRLRAVKNSVTVTKDVTVKTLTGCTGFTASVDISNWKITTKITNTNSANIKLFLYLNCPDEYGGSFVTHKDVISKEIGKINGDYIWTFTDTEKSAILKQLKYTASGTGTVYACSYVPGDTITSSNNISLHSSSSGSFALASTTYKPTISDFTREKDSKTSGLISTWNYLIQGVSDLTTTLPIANIALKSNAELYQVTWTVENEDRVLATTTENYSSQTSFSKKWEASLFQNSGTYTVKAKATDTRGLTSDAKTYTYTVLSYHKPIISAKVVRALSSGGVISIDYTASYSRLAISDADKNSIKSLKYGYKVITTSGEPSATTNLTGYTTSNATNTVDKELSLSNDSWITLDQDTNYRFVFTLQDELNTTTYTVDLVDGTPIMRMLNNGQIGIDMVPDITDLNTKLFIGGNLKAFSIYENDISLIDKYRRYSILTSNAGSGSAGYIHIAQIIIASTYANQPIEIKISQRADSRIASTLFVMFKSESSTDPELASFEIDGNATAYIYKSNTSTWNIYVKKSESYDSISVVDYTVPSYMSSKIALNWKDEFVSEVPEGAVLVTPISTTLNNLTIKENLSIAGNSSVTGDQSVTGNLTVGGTNIKTSINGLDTRITSCEKEKKVRIIADTTTKTNDGHDYVRLHTWSEISGFFKTKYGSAPESKYVVGVSVTNGDGNAVGAARMYAEWWGNNLWVYFANPFTGDVRINFCYTAYY